MNLPQLTFTRFVAALAIVVFHLGGQAWPFIEMPKVVGLFNLAVSYFFTLSGFILVISQVRGGVLPKRIDAKAFYRNRFARIYPLYLLGLLLWAFFKVLSDGSLGSDSLPFCANLALVQSWFPGMATTCNFPGWSLSVETFFYASFPLLFWWGASVSTACMALGFVGLLAFSIFFPGFLPFPFIELPGMAHYFPVVHLGSFAIGMLGGFVLVAKKDALKPYAYLFQALGALGVIGILTYLVFWPGLTIIAHNGGLAPFFVLFILGLSLSPQAKPWLAQGPLPWLGEISYGMYILHMPVCTNIFSYRLAAKLGDVAGVPLFWFQVLILLVVSAACYQWLEIPARRLIRGRKLPPPVVEVAAERSIGLEDRR